jgi:hypothetical protein
MAVSMATVQGWRRAPLRLARVITEGDTVVWVLLSEWCAASHGAITEQELRDRALEGEDWATVLRDASPEELAALKGCGAVRADAEEGELLIELGWAHENTSVDLHELGTRN